MEYRSEVALCLSRSAAERLGREAAALSFDDAFMALGMGRVVPEQARR